MDKLSERRSLQRNFRRWFYIYAIVWVPVSAAYLAILLITTQIGVAQLISSLVANIFFPFLFGLAVYGVMLRWLVHERFWVQVTAHAAGSVVFALLWSSALFRALQVIAGLTSGDWSFAGFTGNALLWQLFQGVVIYYMVAAGTYAIWFYDRLQDVLAQSDSSEDTQPPTLETNILSRFFARSGDDILPVDFKDVISICGADDYAEIRTISGKHLTRITLKDLEAKLDPAQFIRVHRSHIINVDKVVSIEPAGGGRFSIHMQGDETILASRSGAQKLRERVI